MASLRQKARQTVTRIELSRTARQVRERNLTYLQPDRLLVLERAARSLNARRVPGDFIECGVALGGSAIVLARSALKGSALRHFSGYDVFGQIPAPGEGDPPEVHERYATIASGRSPGIGGDTYYGYRDDLLEFVTARLAEFGAPVGERVHLHRGLFDDTLNLSRPVALAHIDCDWHDPVDTCLRRIGPRLSRGGVMILDDYESHGGCRDATDRFLAESPGFELRQFSSNAGVARV